LLAAEHLAKSQGFRDIVSDVSLHVDRGEAVALLGPNGAGKSTVFQMIVGLTLPNDGRVYIDGEDVTELPIFERARRGLNYLPQDPSLFNALTVEQNILLVLEAHEHDRQQRDRFKNALLEQFGLEHIRHASAARVSGGERRRCEIARTLATRPSFVLLDEPFAKLDPIAIGQVRDLVRLLTRQGVGVLITDHNVRETLLSVDHAYMIDAGRIFAEGTPDEIVRDAEVRRIYLE
jgi:lipopolysaccharide export system ATP-binding protein